MLWGKTAPSSVTFSPFLNNSGKQPLLEQQVCFSFGPKVCGNQFIWMCSHCRAWHWVNHIYMWAFLFRSVRTWVLFNIYLECSIWLEVENTKHVSVQPWDFTGLRRLCIQLGKHSFLLWLFVWTGNKEADQTAAQKATAKPNWNRVARLSKLFK